MALYASSQGRHYVTNGLAFLNSDFVIDWRLALTVFTPSHYGRVYMTIWTGHFETNGLGVVISSLNLPNNIIYHLWYFFLWGTFLVPYVRYAHQFWNAPSCTIIHNSSYDPWNAPILQTCCQCISRQYHVYILTNDRYFEHLLWCFYVIRFIYRYFFCLKMYFTLHSVLGLCCLSVCISR